MIDPETPRQTIWPSDGSWFTVIDVHGIVSEPNPWNGPAHEASATIQSTHGRAERGVGPTPGAAIRAAKERWRAALPELEHLLAELESDTQAGREAGEGVILKLKALLGTPRVRRVHSSPGCELVEMKRLLRRAIEVHR